MKFREELLLSILSEPSAPFREAHVIHRIRETLDEARVPYFADPVGNLVLGVKSKKDYLKLIGARSKEPVRFFIAHMDHPGFHGRAWAPDGKLEILWHGGSPLEHFEGAKVWIASKKGAEGHGQLRDVKMLASGRAIETASVQVDPALRSKYPKASDLYGGFGFRAPVWKDGEIYRTKAADDLVGSFSILSVALDLFKKGNKKTHPFIGLLTRAEEVGFIGAIGHFELGWLKKAKRPILGVSLETSRALPGAEIGKGPVVRLGDKFTVFDAGALRVFTELAAKVLPGAHQRRIMDAGTCEASAATVYGFPCVGISVPLGNYHNQSFEGGPDSAGPNGPAPEFVHSGDVQGLLALCHALMTPKLPWATPWKERALLFRKELARYQPLLKSGP